MDLCPSCRGSGDGPGSCSACGAPLAPEVRSQQAFAERIEIFRADDLPGVEVLAAENAARKWRVFHETYTICIIRACRGRDFEWRYRRWAYGSAAGSVMMMEPGEVHSNTAITAPGDFDVLFVPPQTVAAAAAELGIPPAPSLRFGHTREPALFHSFRALHRSLRSAATALERQSLFAAGLRMFLERCTGRAPVPHAHPGPTALRRARAFLHEHASENPSLDELAAAAGLSRFHLVRAFAAEFGLPPHAYQLQLRISRARALLADGLPAAVVAADVGFADQSHLIRHFRTAWGVTPRAYQGAVHRQRRSTAIE